MKINSPIGEYDYRVEGVALRHGQLEVVGRLGQWQTTTVLERSDLLRLGAPLVAVICAVWAVTRRPRRV